MVTADENSIEKYEDEQKLDEDMAAEAEHEDVEYIYVTADGDEVKEADALAGYDVVDTFEGEDESLESDILNDAFTEDEFVIGETPEVPIVDQVDLGLHSSEDEQGDENVLAEVCRFETTGNAFLDKQGYWGPVLIMAAFGFRENIVWVFLLACVLFAASFIWNFLKSRKGKRHPFAKVFIGHGLVKISQKNGLNSGSLYFKLNSCQFSINRQAWQLEMLDGNGTCHVFPIEERGGLNETWSWIKAQAYDQAPSTRASEEDLLQVYCDPAISRSYVVGGFVLIFLIVFIVVNAWQMIEALDRAGQPMSISIENLMRVGLFAYVLNLYLHIFLIGNWMGNSMLLRPDYVIIHGTTISRVVKYDDILGCKYSWIFNRVYLRVKGRVTQSALYFIDPQGAREAIDRIEAKKMLLRAEVEEDELSKTLEEMA